jgi:tetratricopeptide (TPR) repeat protein
MTTRLSLTMIVKNEAATLDHCLVSVRDLVDEIVVVDTGSHDATPNIARRHGARVFEMPWPDSFAAARNESLRHATGQWLLWLDADEYLDETNRAKLRALLAQLPDDNTAYVMDQRSHAATGSATLVGQVRLFRNHPAIRWDYRVHEQILPSLKRAGHAVRFTDLAIDHSGYLDPALRHKKLERNLRLLHLDLAERPNDAFTLFNLGWSFADLGRCGEAIPLLQKSLHHSRNADSITPKLYSLLTQCHRRLGQYAEAWAVCQAGHVRCPDDAELLFLKGQLCKQRGDGAAARACWTQLLAGTPHPQPFSPAGRGEPTADGVFTSVDAGLRGPLVRHHLALLDREEGRLADAEQHWQTLLADSPSYPAARIGLAELYVQQARWPELETLLAELESHAALDAVLLRARMHLARREFASARQLLENIIPQAPHVMMAYVLLSHVLLQSGDEAAAEPLLRRIVEMDASHAESWRNLAVLYRRRHRFPEAIAAAKAGCLYCPHDADLLLLYGVLLHEGGDALNAETCLLRVLDADTGDGPARQRRLTARQHLAGLYQQLGRLQEATAHWRAILAEQPDHPVASLGLADCLLIQRRWPELETLLARLEANPALAQATLLLHARLHLAREQFEQAERALMDVLELDPDNGEARRNLARLRRRLLAAP